MLTSGETGQFLFCFSPVWSQDLLSWLDRISWCNQLRDWLDAKAWGYSRVFTAVARLQGSQRLVLSSKALMEKQDWPSLITTLGLGVPVTLCYLSSLLHSLVQVVDTPVFSNKPWTTWGEGCITTFRIQWLNSLVPTHLVEWIPGKFLPTPVNVLLSWNYCLA